MPDFTRTLMRTLSRHDSARYIETVFFYESAGFDRCLRDIGRRDLLLQLPGPWVDCVEVRASEL